MVGSLDSVPTVICISRSVTGEAAATHSTADKQGPHFLARSFVSTSILHREESNIRFRLIIRFLATIQASDRKSLPMDFVTHGGSVSMRKELYGLATWVRITGKR